MTATYIHDRGRVLVFKQPAIKYADLTETKPQAPQRARPRGTWKAWREMRMPKDHNGYKPGFVYDLGTDQCRFIPGDDYVCCGAKVRDGSSYCEEHHVRTRRQKVEGGEQ